MPDKERLLLHNLILTEVQYQTANDDAVFSNRNPMFIRSPHPAEIRLKFVGRYGNEMNFSCTIENPEEAQRINEFIHACDPYGSTEHSYSITIESATEHSMKPVTLEMPKKEPASKKTRVQSLEFT